MQKRRYKEDVNLSILGLGGMALVGMDSDSAGRLVAESVERGINYFDVAPFYGDGEAERKLGPALLPYRRNVFLACKTLCRDARGALRELECSLKNLRTNHFDLYQFHAVSSGTEVEEIFASGGAMEAFLDARRQGRVRFIGFSAHSVAAALAMMDRFKFDSILFPVNFACFSAGSFGPQVLQRAKELDVARLALKSLALGPWRRNEKRPYPNCWYRPITDAELARQALRFTLSEDITAAIPPGDERLFRLALDLSDDLPPMTAEERSLLIASTKTSKPIFRLKKNVR